MWDRSLWYQYKNKYTTEIFVPGYDRIFVGHTSIWKTSNVPIKSGNVIFMDTGGGWEGKLSIMNIDTEKVFQSDLLEDLYPEGHN
jgi:serine/threonine protein phosphatase 1